MQLDPWLVKVIVLVAVVAWIGLTVASVLVPTIEVPASLNGIFMSIAGGAVAMAAKRNKPDNDGHDGDNGGDA